MAPGKARSGAGWGISAVSPDLGQGSEGVSPVSSGGSTPEGLLKMKKGAHSEDGKGVMAFKHGERRI